MTDKKPPILTVADVRAALVDLPDWRTQLNSLQTVYKCASSTDAVELVYRIGQLANEIDHHPDVDWRYDHVFIRTTTHSIGRKVTANDLELATKISALAASAEAKPELFRTVEIAVDTTHPETIRATWATLLGYKEFSEADLFDPWGRGPSIWFQQTETPDPSRLHLDVWVEDSTSDDVVTDTERAGAQRLDDRYRPSFTVVGDEDGNRFCVCTSLDRD